MKSLPEQLKEIKAMIRRITPIGGSGVRTAQTENGTVISAATGSAKPDITAEPFQPGINVTWDDDAGTVTINLKFWLTDPSSFIDETLVFQKPAGSASITFNQLFNVVINYKWDQLIRYSSASLVAVDSFTENMRCASQTGNLFSLLLNGADNSYVIKAYKQTNLNIQYATVSKDQVTGFLACTIRSASYNSDKSDTFFYDITQGKVFFKDLGVVIPANTSYQSIYLNFPAYLKQPSLTLGSPASGQLNTIIGIISTNAAKYPAEIVIYPLSDLNIVSSTTLDTSLITIPLSGGGNIQYQLSSYRGLFLGAGQI